MDSRYTKLKTNSMITGKWLMLYMALMLISQLAFADQVTASMYNESPPDQQRLLSVHFENKPLAEVLHQLARKVDVGISYKTEIVPSTRVTYGAENTSIFTILDAVLEGTGLKVTLSANRKVILIKRKLAKAVVQQSTITGTVTDGSTGETLPGVNIAVKGTTTGTATDTQGQYELTVESLQDTLVFSFVGYQTRQVPIQGRTNINITLQTQTVVGEELVVTALGLERNTRSLGYSTSTVKPEDVTVDRTTNFAQSLQGKIPGVNISSNATGAGGSTRISIRGQSAFAGDNQPLIVVDGVPIDNTRHFGGTQGANNSDTGDGLISIDPDDIESMTVLKGGSAAALYGSRAKDGVIMITTKNHSSSGGFGVTFSSNFTINKAIDETDFQYGYGQGEKGKRPTSPFPDSGVWSFGEKIEPGMTQVLFDGVEVPYVPQRNQITDFYNGGYTNTNTLSLATGNKDRGFNLSISQLKNDGITPNSGFDRYNISLGFTQDITSSFNVSGNVNYSREIHRNPPQINAQDMTSTKTIFTLSNTMPLYLLKEFQRDENGNEIVFSRFKNRTNPYISVNDAFNDIKRNRIFGNIKLRYDFTDWLYLQGRVGQDYYARDEKLNFPSLMAGTSPAPPGFVNGNVTKDERIFREINADFLIGANPKVSDRFGTKFTFGGNIMKRRRDRNSIQGIDFIVPFLYTVANSRVKNPLYEYSDRQVNSLYGSADFSYNDYLYLSVTARNDWFSTLSPNERSVLYPSVSGSFVFSDLIDGLPAWLNLGKIRAAYAEVGSDTDVAPFSQSLNYSIGTNLFQGPTSNQPLSSISTDVIPNPNLKPMRVKSYEFGLNLQMLNRINFDITYYHKRSIDQIINAAVSNTSGYTSRLINIGESVNRGFEGLLDITAVESRNFLWDVSLNTSYNASEVIKLGEDNSDVSIGGTVRQVVGMPLGQIYTSGYQRDDQGRKIFNPNNGLPLQTPNDIHVGNSIIPKWVGGISSTFKYKDFSLYALVDFKLGNSLYSDADRDFVRHGKSKKSLPGRDQGYVIGDGVTPDGSVNTTKVDVQTYYEADANIGEDHVYNAGFWKLRQVSLSYNFTKLMSSGALPVEGLTLSAVANNVYTIKKWTDNLDPEMVDDASGIQQISLPLIRSYGFNLKIKF